MRAPRRVSLRGSGPRGALQAAPKGGFPDGCGRGSYGFRAAGATRCQERPPLCQTATSCGRRPPSRVSGRVREHESSKGSTTMRTKLVVACALTAFVAVSGATAEATGLIHTSGIAKGAVTFNRLSPGVRKMVSAKPKPRPEPPACPARRHARHRRPQRRRRVGWSSRPDGREGPEGRQGRRRYERHRTALRPPGRHGRGWPEWARWARRGIQGIQGIQGKSATTAPRVTRATSARTASTVDAATTA